MTNRRDFIKKAALLSGGVSVFSSLPASIQRAMAIDPKPGSTFLDAEHIVILMQENRSFDHCYGTLRGVRGYDDPRAIQLPDKNKVWLQSNQNGQTFAPFRLNLKESKATWMHSLPHSWKDQTDARNKGKYDKWLSVKQSGHQDWASMPLTLGYYNREDIPFYYSLADAFTVCDQCFCSALTGTTPNRLYLWTGTIRDEQKHSAKANIRNEEVDYGREAHWTTFPERLEDNGISWKIYQNEISAAGLEAEKDNMLANFTDNPLEWFTSFHVRFAKGPVDYLQRKVKELPDKISALTLQIADATEEDKVTLKKQLEECNADLKKTKQDIENFTAANFEKLSTREQSLHSKAFTTNVNDPNYHELESLTYRDGDTERNLQVPKGDILHQFREDVTNGKLPAISWLVAPREFSDHPDSPWYGAWYISEVMDILTKEEETWKKTIFILCYDENDGYFDHIPPFTAPFKPEEGKVSAGIDTRLEYITGEEERAKKYLKEEDIREGPVGLGYRVPLVIASPWSRGGYVNSQVFDHTSVLQFLEHFLQNKTGKQIKETNISDWRRTICGDLTSVFRPFNGEKVSIPFPKREDFMETLHNSKFKNLPHDFKALTADEIAMINTNPAQSEWMPHQEKGTRPSNALPYELYVNGKLTPDKKFFEISFKAAEKFFGKQAAGAPFNVYAPGRYLPDGAQTPDLVRTWSYAVKPGDELKDSWPISSFEESNYHLKAYGPNGFYREFTGNAGDPLIEIVCLCQYDIKSNKKLTGNVELLLINHGASAANITIHDHAYHLGEIKKTVKSHAQVSLVIDLTKSHCWYDFSVKVTGNQLFEQRFAGRVETGRESFSDPVIGK